MEDTARRALLGSLLAGVALGAGGSPAEAAERSGARLLPASRLRAGDLIVGPDGRVVRVAAQRRLASGRRRISYTDPASGSAVPLDHRHRTSGVRARTRFVVLARGVPASAVRISPPGRVIDGGRP